MKFGYYEIESNQNKMIRICVRSTFTSNTTCKHYSWIFQFFLWNEKHHWKLKKMKIRLCWTTNVINTSLRWCMLFILSRIQQKNVNTKHMYSFDPSPRNEVSFFLVMWPQHDLIWFESWNCSRLFEKQRNFSFAWVAFLLKSLQQQHNFGGYIFTQKLCWFWLYLILRVFFYVWYFFLLFSMTISVMSYLLPWTK